eukprot:SAG11_NODE_2770_length_2990_cov_7.803250_2_plen_79_part_00
MTHHSKEHTKSLHGDHVEEVDCAPGLAPLASVLLVAQCYPCTGDVLTIGREGINATFLKPPPLSYENFLAQEERASAK